MQMYLSIDKFERISIGMLQYLPASVELLLHKFTSAAVALIYHANVKYVFQNCAHNIGISS